MINFTPTVAGTFSIKITVSDGVETDSQAYELTITNNSFRIKIKATEKITLDSSLSTIAASPNYGDRVAWMANKGNGNWDIYIAIIS